MIAPLLDVFHNILQCIFIPGKETEVPRKGGFHEGKGERNVQEVGR